MVPEAHILAIYSMDYMLKFYTNTLSFHLESECDINCALCPYHKGENIRRHTWGKPQTWKRHRRTQYKVVEIVG